nr:MAG TPA: hypothetical protein [Caudoviricetes sp.]
MKFHIAFDFVICLRIAMPFLYSLKNGQKNERNFIKRYYYAHFI